MATSAARASTEAVPSSLPPRGENVASAAEEPPAANDGVGLRLDALPLRCLCASASTSAASTSS